MEKSAFISFSSKDQKIAALICEALEERGIGCWISTRDVKPGENFQAAIVQAIRAAKAMILVFSGNANNSDEIKKEIVLAGQNHLVVIPVRVEDVQPNDALAYEFATRQWVDLFEDWEQAMHRLLDQLQTIAGVVATIGTGAADLANAPEHLHSPLPDAPVSRLSLSMVVLPFVNITGDPGQDRLVDAVTQQLTDGLARIEHSFVVPRETALAFRRSTLGEAEIGRKLGVRYAIKGSIHAHEGRLRVSAQLTDAKTGESLWVDQFDTPIGRATQQRLAARWLAELETQLLVADGRAPFPEPPVSPQPETPALKLPPPEGNEVIHPRDAAATPQPPPLPVPPLPASAQPAPKLPPSGDEVVRPRSAAPVPQPPPPQPAVPAPKPSPAGDVVIRARGAAAVPPPPQPALSTPKPPPTGDVVIYPRGVAAPTQPRTVLAAQRRGAPFRVPFLIKLAVVAAAGGAAVAVLGADRYSAIQIVSWMFVAAGGIQILAVLADVAGGD